MSRIFAQLLFAAGMVLALLILPQTLAMAVEPGEILKDAKLEARARAISAGLRCLVCQNQSIDDSNAELARDLRILVRERLSAGDTDEQTVGYIVDRYGEFVLLKPRFGAHTVLLWFAPLLIFLAAIFFIYRYFKGRAVLNAPGADSGIKALTKSEKKKLKAVLSE